MKLERIDIVGIVILTKKNCPLMLDRYGLALFQKYGEGKGGWNYSDSIPYLHRKEYVMKGDRLTTRIVRFSHELLGSRCQVINGDELDLRIVNLEKVEEGSLYSWKGYKQFRRLLVS